MFADTCVTCRSGSCTTSRTPRGWTLPGTWIGSRAQLSRSMGVPGGSSSGVAHAGAPAATGASQSASP